MSIDVSFCTVFFFCPVESYFCAGELNKSTNNQNGKIFSLLFNATYHYIVRPFPYNMMEDRDQVKLLPNQCSCSCSCIELFKGNSCAYTLTYNSSCLMSFTITRVGGGGRGGEQITSSNIIGAYFQNLNCWSKFRLIKNSCIIETTNIGKI